MKLDGPTAAASDGITALEILGVLSGRMIHSFSNDITGMAGNLALLRARAAGDPEAELIAGRLERILERMGDHLRGAAEMRRSVVPELETVSVSEVVVLAAEHAARIPGWHVETAKNLPAERAVRCRPGWLVAVLEGYAGLLPEIPVVVACQIVLVLEGFEMLPATHWTEERPEYLVLSAVPAADAIGTVLWPEQPDSLGSVCSIAVEMVAFMGGSLQWDHEARSFRLALPLSRA